MWEEKANKANEESGALLRAQISSIHDLAYECCWDNCDWQFEDIADCVEHCVAEQTGHVFAYFAAAKSGIFKIF